MSYGQHQHLNIERDVYAQSHKTPGAVLKNASWGIWPGTSAVFNKKGIYVEKLVSLCEKGSW